MKRNNYQFDPEQLRYVSVNSSLKLMIRKQLPGALLSILAGTGVFLLLASLAHTPAEKVLKTQNQLLVEKYFLLNRQFDSLSTKLSKLENRDDEIYRTVFGMPPVEGSMRRAGTGGNLAKESLPSYPELVKETARRLEQLNSRLTLESNSLNKLTRQASNNSRRLLHLPAIMPVSNEDLTRTGSGFGMRYHPILNITRMHEGIDFIVPSGTEIYATAAGTVSSTRRSNTFGNIVVIDHGYGYETLYAHLSKILVKPGNKVKRGQLIALSGNTGLSAGAHLHYEVHKDKKEIDPVNYFFNDLSPSQYAEIMRIARETVSSLD